MYTHSFDSDDRLKTHPVGNDTRTLAYDAASRITQTADTNPVYNRIYDHDGLDRLISQSDNTSFKLWSYDANSSRTQYETGSAAYAYTIASNSNRLQTVSGPIAKTYTYDAAGNPKSDGQTTFTWNAGRKRATTLRGGKTHTHQYNALDQRISKNGPLSVRYFFFYDDNDQLIGEYKDNVSTSTPTNDWLVLQETVWLGDIPIAVIKKPTATSAIQTYYIHADHLNTPRVIVNANNTTLCGTTCTHLVPTCHLRILMAMANCSNTTPDSLGSILIRKPTYTTIISAIMSRRPDGTYHPIRLGWRGDRMSGGM